MGEEEKSERERNGEKAGTHLHKVDVSRPHPPRVVISMYTYTHIDGPRYVLSARHRYTYPSVIGGKTLCHKITQKSNS